MKNYIIIGYGDRSKIYSKNLVSDSDENKIIGVVEPNDFRRNEAKVKFNIAEENCFKSVDECVIRGKIADAVINGTMDNVHVETSIPFLKLGYDMLLEKPITNNNQDLDLLIDLAAKNNCKLMVCHVLRYTPFYSKIKQAILDGVIGEIVNITTGECVSVVHASNSYIRGKWNNKERCGSSMLLAKCSHDIDIIAWLNSNLTPKKVSSFGGRYFFVKENAPENAGTKCLVDCPHEKECFYSARKLYLEHDVFPWLAWDCFNKDIDSLTEEEKINSLKTFNKHGECIFKTDANIIDRQVVIIEFENGSIASHTLIAGVARAGRNIHVVGSKGEIEGFLEDNCFKIRTYNPTTISYDEQIIDFSDNVSDGDGHSGGDSRLVADFVSYINNQKPSISTTTITDSANGHKIIFCADESLDKDGAVIYLSK